MTNDVVNHGSDSAPAAKPVLPDLGFAGSLRAASYNRAL